MVRFLIEFSKIVSDLDIAINGFHRHVTLVHSLSGDTTTYWGTNAWDFLLFCAIWTVLTVVLSFVALRRFADRSWIAYVLAILEAVAILSWFAGWLSCAVLVSSNDVCGTSENKSSCRAVKAAIFFGVLEWMLFIGTGMWSAKLAWKSFRKTPGSLRNTSSRV